MLLKEHGFIWPPSRVGDIAAPPADVEDTVLSIQKCAKPKGLLRLTLRNKIGGEYAAALLVPEFLQEKIIFLILRKENMTLREVGKLPIAESAFVEPVMTASQSSSLPAAPAKQTRRTRLYGALRPLFARVSATIAILLRWLE
jgi:hypothetical protein